MSLEIALQRGDVPGLVTFVVRNAGELARNPSFHDLQDVFGKNPAPCYFDCCHTNEQANEIVARRMLTDVAPVTAAR